MNANMTREQFSNLLFLRDTVIPWMERNPGRVDFDQYESECGTYRCLLGNYCHMAFGSFRRSPLDYLHTGLDDAGRTAAHFGIQKQDCFALFGNLERGGPLPARKSRLNAIIAEHQHLFEQALPFHELMRQLQAGELEAVA